MSTRITLAQGKVRNETYPIHCPTCGATRLVDGGVGARAHHAFCTAACYSKYHRYTLARTYLQKAGNATSATTTIPVVIGDS